MPRKGNYRVDYEDDYDAYEDYEYYDNENDYDDGYNAKENGVVPETKEIQEAAKIGIWRCPICTYDNEDDMSACEICGVLRNPLVKGHNKSSSGPAPYKFDGPSPDDLVSSGMRSSTLGSKANFKTSSSPDVSRKEKELKIEVEREISIEGHDSSSASTSKKKDVSRKEKELKIEVEREISIEGHDSSSASTSKKKGPLLKIEGKPQIISGDMMKMSMSSKSGSAKNANRARALASAPFKPEKWMLPDQIEDKLSQLNLAIVGHVDSGKSTLSGRLLHLLGRISQKEFHKYEREAKQQGKGSFAYAWALDESAEERERGITMTVAVAFFDTKKYHIVLLDSPGHKDFVPNMISGATQADAAILVIDASVGAFEAGMDASGGQTREHTQLIRSFGADQIIVAVNKMDAVEYSRERFDIIKQKLGVFLRSCSFKESSILWIPMSAMENQNLVDVPSDTRLSWYQGLCLLDAIDSLQPPVRDYSKPLLLPICDVIKSQSQGQLSVVGKVENGALRSGYKVLVMPSGEIATVRSLERDNHVCNIARAGDNVTVSLQGVDPNRVTAGGVLCHPDFPVAVSKHFELKIVVLDVTTPILIGSQLEFHIHHTKEVARVVKILSLLDPKTGKVSKKSPRCLLSKQNAVIEVALEEEVCVEEYSRCKALGRVSLRASGRTIALGVVTKIVQNEQ
ncbi:unnamed protein product [Coffea canephora]|uniref:Tr-type G domain-containing protein n=1 Tax=Coffea canephora TaxID=49390 RepID=A0A068TQ24_COFCA|nr:unnamed protein product [Coffea canephora]